MNLAKSGNIPLSLSTNKTFDLSVLYLPNNNSPLAQAIAIELLIKDFPSPGAPNITVIPLLGIKFSTALKERGSKEMVDEIITNRINEYNEIINKQREVYQQESIQNPKKLTWGMCPYTHFFKTAYMNIFGEELRSIIASTYMTFFYKINRDLFDAIFESYKEGNLNSDKDIEAFINGFAQPYMNEEEYKLL